MRKYLIVLIAVAMVAVMFAGCTSSSPSATDTPVLTPVKTITPTQIATPARVANTLTPTPVQTTVVTTAATTKAPLILSGTGDDVVSFTSTGTALRVFTMKHSGKSNFAVVLKEGDGTYLKLLANEIGAYSGKKSEQLSTGKYYLDVTADGPWTIQIAS